MAKPIVCNLFNSLNTPRLNTEMGKPIFFDLGIGIIGFFCFAFRYRYFTVFRYFGKMSVPITREHHTVRPKLRAIASVESIILEALPL